MIKILLLLISLPVSAHVYYQPWTPRAEAFLPNTADRAFGKYRYDLPSIIYFPQNYYEVHIYGDYRTETVYDVHCSCYKTIIIRE